MEECGRQGDFIRKQITQTLITKIFNPHLPATSKEKFFNEPGPTMSLEKTSPVLTVGSPKSDHMIQRFSWRRPTGFTQLFTLRLDRNSLFPKCDENEVLDTEGRVPFLLKGRQLFDQVMIRSGYDLNTFTKWSTSGITRFTLRTTADNADPVLDIDDDPSTIRYDSVSDFQRRL